MKISSKDLQDLVRNFLFEQEEPVENAEDEKQEEAELSPEEQIRKNIEIFEDISFNIGDVNVLISVDEIGGLRLSIRREGFEDEEYFVSISDIVNRQITYFDFIFKVSEVLAGVEREDTLAANEIYTQLETVLMNFDDAVNHPQSLKTFDKLYVLKNPGDSS